MKMSIGPVPIVYPHHHQSTKDWIPQLFNVGQLKLSLGTRGGVLDWNTANTSQGNGQSTQPIPTSTSHVPGHVTVISPLGTPWEHFEKKVTVMSLSGSFKVFFAVSPVVQSQCSQPVKLKMSQNGELDMFQTGKF